MPRKPNTWHETTVCSWIADRDQTIIEQMERRAQTLENYPTQKLPWRWVKALDKLRSSDIVEVEPHRYRVNEVKAEWPAPVGRPRVTRQVSRRRAALVNRLLDETSPIVTLDDLAREHLRETEDRGFSFTGQTDPNFRRVWGEGAKYEPDPWEFGRLQESALQRGNLEAARAIDAISSGPLAVRQALAKLVTALEFSTERSETDADPREGDERPHWLAVEEFDRRVIRLGTWIRWKRGRGVGSKNLHG